MDRFDALVSPILMPLTRPPISLVVTLLVVLYAAQVRPQLLPQVEALLSKGWFRLVVLYLIVWTASRNPSLSLVLSFGLLAAFNTMNGKPIFEMFTGDYAKTAVYPGCLTVSLADILESFGNDKGKMVSALIRANVPPNIQINDSNSPLLATFLVNAHEMKITDSCGPPLTAYTQN
jgi:hypothetical protein